MNSKKHKLPRRILAMLLAICMFVTMFPSAMFAVEGTGDSGAVANDSVGNTENGITVNKSISQDDNGDYNLTLEAYASNQQTTTSTTTPLDIVLVLDVSGSMDDPIGGGTFTYTAASKQEWSYNDVYRTRTTYYYLADDGQYYRVYAASQRVQSGRQYSLTYGASKEDAQKIPDSQISNSREGTLYEGKLYTREFTANNTSRIDALTSAANAFIDKVSENASTNDVEHRISLVKFAGDSTNERGNDTYESGGLFWNYEYNYSQIVRDFTDVSQSGNAGSLKDSIRELDPMGATRADYGLAHAQTLLNNARQGAKKVVIMFTDGSPTSGNTFEDSVANAAIRTAKSLKENDTTIYTVGVFNGANPNGDSEENRYMNGVSSNYPRAETYNDLGQRVSGDENYYFAANSSESLESVFEGIADEVTTGTLTANPDAAAVLSDTLSQYFDFTADAEGSAIAANNVKYVPAKDYIDGKFTWREPTNILPDGTELEVQVELKGDTITVTGFDYKTYAASYNSSKKEVSGGKLVVTFPIEVDENAVLDQPTDDNMYPTNVTEVTEEDNRAKLSYKSSGSGEVTTNDSVTALDESPQVYVNRDAFEGNGTDVTVQVYVNGQKVNDPSSYVNITRDTTDTNYSYFKLTGPDDEGTLTADFNYDDYDCVDLKVDVKDDNTYILQGVKSYQSHGSDGTDNVRTNNDKNNTYTVDNVTAVGNSTDPDCTIYLYTKYTVEYYDNSGALSGDLYDDETIYISGLNNIKSTTQDGPAEDAVAWMDWKTETPYSNAITLPELPSNTDGWYLGTSNDTTYAKDTEFDAINATSDTADGKSADRVIEFNAKDKQQHTITINYVDGDNPETTVKGQYTDTRNEGYEYSFDVSDDSEGTIPFIIEKDDKQYVFDQITEGSADLSGTLTTDIVITAEYLVDENKNEVPDKYEATVTYKVVNGTWEDETTADKTAQFKLKEFDEESNSWQDVTPTPTLGDTIPTNMKPNSGYADGAWDPIITADTEVTGNATYTYTFSAVQYTLTYNGNPIDGATVTDVPVDDKTYQSGASATLSSQIPVYSEENVAFIGWSLEQTDKIYSAGEDYEEKGALIEGSVTFENSNIELYAVWGYDTNGDNIADAKQIIVTPANIIIYTGGQQGQDGFEGVVNEDGTIVGSTSLPEPGFTVILPYEIKDTDVTDLTFTESPTATTRTWKLQPYDGVHTTVYKLVPTGSNPNGGEQDPIRVKFTRADGTTIVSSDFTVGLEVNTSFGMSIYKGEVGGIQTTVNNKVYTVNSDPTATLTVRGTTDQAQYASVNAEQTDTSAPALEAADNTVFTINDSDVTVEADNVALLFDEIIETAENAEGNDRAEALVAKADDVLNVSAGDMNYDLKYLDLVDTQNGNVWVKASQDVTIYWPLPEGTTQNTEFTLMHFEGLHRDMDPDEVNNMISGCTVDTATSEAEGNHIAIVDVTEDYVVIETGANGFSPFALAWEADNGGSDTPDNPGWTPGGSGDEPDGLNTEDHFSYIVGYAEDYRTGEPTDNEDLWPVKPNNQITRAEVATIFYRLLEDEVRDEYDTTVNDFSDVSADSWYNQTVSTLASMEIVKGYEDGTFRPNAPITRAEFGAIATRFFAETGATYVPGTFSDVTGDEWYANAIQDAVNLGLIGGYEDGTVRPNNNITRAEACAIVNRTLGRVPDADHLLPDDVMKVWPDNNPTDWFYADMQEATNGHEYAWIEEDGHEIEEWTNLLDKDWTDR